MNPMATPPTQDSLKMFELLSDRKWHRYIDVRNEIAKTVPPGRGFRKYQENRRNDKQFKNWHHNDPIPPSTKPEAEQIEIGQRACAQVAISSWKRQGVILQRGQNDGREIRVRPGWTSPAIPGYEVAVEDDEPVLEPQDPPLAGPGVPELGVAPVEAFQPLTGQVEDVFPDRAAIDVALAAQLEDPVQPTEAAEVDSASPEGAVAAEDGCELCGLTIGNAARHAQWHRELKQGDTPSEMALLNESQLSDLLSKVVFDALNSFQAGMQRHIDGQFAHLEGMLAASMRMQLLWSAQGGNEPPSGRH